MSTATPLRGRALPSPSPRRHTVRRGPTRGTARRPRSSPTRTVRRDLGLEVPSPSDRLQDMVLTLVSISAGPVLLVSGTAILGVPVGSALAPEALEIAQENLPRLDAGLRDVERVVGLGAAALGLLLSAASLLAVLATSVLVLLTRLGRWNAGPVHTLLDRLSPGFMRRTLVLALTAQLAVGGAGVTTGLLHHPGQDASLTAEISETAQGDWDEHVEHPAGAGESRHGPLDETRSAAAQATSDESAGGGDPQTHDLAPPEEDQMSPLFTPETPGSESDRHQGLETRERTEREVTVRAGDTLWSIAADELGPHATDWEIAEHWPQWYEANRAVIGEDPSRLLPGTVLCPPEDDRIP